MNSFEMERRLRRNIKSAISRGLPELRPQAQQLAPLTLLASGPSAARASFHAPVMALNGALRLFTAEGGAPTFWAACDAGPNLAAIVADAPASTTYFVCSRCDPALFNALAGRRVVLWHLAEHFSLDLLTGRTAVPTAMTITVCAMGLAYAMGFRRLETWGWDGCFMDGAPYAVDQEPTGSRHRVHVGAQDGPAFETTGTWLAEARDAKEVLSTAPYSVRVHGGGMFAAILTHNQVRQVSAA